METIQFYCQQCDAKISVEQMGRLEEGRCPECGSIKGYSTAPRSETDPFESVTVVNDTQMLEKVWESKP